MFETISKTEAKEILKGLHQLQKEYVEGHEDELYYGGEDRLFYSNVYNKRIYGKMGEYYFYSLPNGVSYPRQVKVAKENTIIVDGAGDQQEIADRVSQIKVQIEETNSEFDKTWITDSTVKDIVETPVTENITTNIYKVNALKLRILTICIILHLIIG